MEEQKDIRQPEQNQYKERIQQEIENVSTADLLKTSLDDLQSRIGVESFDFLSNLIEGLGNMNPEKKARKKIFLTESQRKKERNDLKNRMKLWVEVLSSEGDLYSLVDNCEKAYESSKKLYTENLSNAVEEVK